MGVPVSTLFDIFDWNARATTTGEGQVLGGADNLVSYSTVNGGSLAEAGQIAFWANGAAIAQGVATSSLILHKVIPDSYTFETEFVITDEMPSGVSDQDFRVFLGISNRYVNSAGFLLTSKGIWLARDITDSAPQMIQSSAGYITSNTGEPQRVVLRAVVAAGRIAVYLGVYSDVYEATSGSWWLFPNLSQLQNLPVKIAEQPDGFYIQLRAPSASLLTQKLAKKTAGLSAIFVLYSARLSTQLLVPQQRPVAAIDMLRQIQVSRAIVPNGAGSRDKYGGVLTYDWSVEQAPIGSLAKLQGATVSSASTVVGAATNADFIVYAKKADSVCNLYTLKLVSGGINKTFGISFTSNTLLVQLATDGAGVVTTTAASVYAAFRSEFAIGYTAAIAELFTLELALANTEGDGLVLPLVVAFAGGTGSALQAPVFIPDMPGPYTLGLRVSSGTARSAKVLSSFSATQTDELFGYRPNADYIFKYLPDFWNMVRGTEQLSSVWGAVAQIVSAEMVQAWQHDYSKSIRDIARKHQRKWLSYSSLVDAPEGAVIAPLKLANGILADVGTLITPPSGFNNYLIGNVTLSGSYTTAPLIKSKAIYRATKQEPQVVLVSQCKLMTGGVANVTISSVPCLTSISKGIRGSFTGTPAGTTLPFTAPGLSLFGLKAAEIAVRLTIDSTTYLLPVSNVNVQTSVLLLDTTNSTLDGSKQPLETGTIVWELLNTSYTGRLTVRRSIEFPVGTLLNKLDIKQGDLVRFQLFNPYGGAELLVDAPIICYDNTTMFVEWLPVIQVLNQAAESVGAVQDWTEKKLETVTIVVHSFVRTMQTEITTDLLSVPTLSSTTVSGEYQENLDYTITGNRAVFTDLVSSQASTSDTHFICSNPLFLKGVDATSTLATLGTKGASILRVINGRNAGFYQLTQASAGVYGTDTPMVYSETQAITIPRFSYYHPPPQRFWAEVSYFDNAKTIENNFGLYVGLPKHLLDEATDRIDYLTIVRALCFGYMHGATLDNIGLVAEAFSGIAYTEHRGQITHIETPSTVSKGFLVYRDEFGRDVTFNYPLGANIANNPTTGRPITSFPLTKDSKQLSAADLLLWQDSRLPSYTRLFSAVKVTDYISDSTRMDTLLPGTNIITKYHTFAVDIPLDITRNTDTFHLIKTHIRAMKPAHTNFILFGSYHLLDDISVEDILKFKPTLRLRDTPNGAQWSLVQNGLKVNAGGYPLLYPSDGLVSKVFADGASNILTDTLERYESGYQQGVMDDWSGDGSWNSAHKEVDQVNQLDQDDTDVLSSRVWVPVLKQIAAGQDIIEFAVGEEVTLWDDNGAIADHLDAVAAQRYMWQTSPPVILHIGSGEHPKLGFNIYAPQTLHPYTYLLLGFNRPQTAASFSDKTLIKTNYGAKERLNGITTGNFWKTGTLKIKGSTSGALATPSVVLDIANTAHAKYFLLERMNNLDKLVSYNPIANATAAITFYIPFAAVAVTTIADVRAKSAVFDVNAVAADPANTTAFNALASKYRRQLQQFPYNSAAADNTQFVPSIGPGLFLDWSDQVDADAFTLGYDDVGAVVSTPTAITAFTALTGIGAPLQNVHIGIQVQKHSDYHLSHGFLKIALPKPIILYLDITQNIGNITARIEGCYFIAPDLTVAHPGVNSYVGTLGGSWAFLRDNAGVETAAVLCTFEQGTNPGLVVLGLDGADQTSTGHVLNAVFPPSTVPGEYYVVVKHFRNYNMASGSATLLQVDTAVSQYTITIAGDPAEFGAGFGDAPFGGS